MTASGPSRSARLLRVGTITSSGGGSPRNLQKAGVVAQRSSSTTAKSSLRKASSRSAMKLGRRDFRKRLFGGIAGRPGSTACKLSCRVWKQEYRLNTVWIGSGEPRRCTRMANVVGPRRRAQLFSLQRPNISTTIGPAAVPVVTLRA
eukprot:CAMPEP_0197639702 /NCGR_PEP_ID=MMETSP1338-20131121/14244_1 /TAXON_ID=43686 ORGANISM="Pelagodinium beii, Strain RCC1491" /NCGR_SAMPLE_ID=MMETSP1338 /ASSEMBLY_ACC=CAM_ASM_000754 /LENGTH=146 /DNA_ID=CAMNT_0043212469 /DNA_START=39 /DNA_END=475 /DNA_ORIENTATION=-